MYIIYIPIIIIVEDNQQSVKKMLYLKSVTLWDTHTHNMQWHNLYNFSVMDRGKNIYRWRISHTCSPETCKPNITLKEFSDAVYDIIMIWETHSSWHEITQHTACYCQSDTRQQSRQRDLWRHQGRVRYLGVYIHYDSWCDDRWQKNKQTSGH